MSSIIILITWEKEKNNRDERWPYFKTWVYLWFMFLLDTISKISKLARFCILSCSLEDYNPPKGTTQRHKQKNGGKFKAFNYK